MARAAEVADAVRLDDDEEAALGVATTNDLMSLAEILDSNPQEFIMEAYADKLKFFEPDENVKVNLEELIAKVKSNDKDLKELILTNTKDIKESDGSVNRFWFFGNWRELVFELNSVHEFRVWDFWRVPSLVLVDNPAAQCSKIEK